MAKTRKDFKVKRYCNSARKEELWQVYCARDHIYVITKSEEKTEEYADLLNKDPWYFDRVHWNNFQQARQ